MKIFIGSSREALATAERVARWIADGTSQTPLLWNEPGCFRHEHHVFGELLRLSREVDGAVLVFSEDDKTWVRGGEEWSVRDNVVLEFGLFLGALGRGSIRRLVVGEPHCASDLAGVHAIGIPASVTDPAWRPRCAEAETAIVDWAKGLLPVFLKGIGFRVARAFDELGARGSYPVADILRPCAKRLIERNDSAEIKAVCSDKGEHGPAYYKMQFDWARQKPERRVCRIFVRQKDGSGRAGFSDDEITAVRFHREHKADGVEARWIYRDDPDLGDSYTSSLGFAVFGRGWLAHWGLERGWYYEPGGGFSGAEVGPLLEARFDALWKRAWKFDEPLIGRLRGE